METERLVFGVILQFHPLGYFDSDPYFFAYFFTNYKLNLLVRIVWLILSQRTG